jgi:hypothetical protein
MALASSWVQATNRIPDVFSKIRDGQAPSQVTQQLLKDWGFASSSDRAFLPLLKALNFLTPAGQPTQRYHDYRDHSRSKAVMAEALREAYHDIFLIKSNPTKNDQTSIVGKFKSFHNVSDDISQRMSKTFFALLDLADMSANNGAGVAKPAPAVEHENPSATVKASQQVASQLAGLHYNVQIHLPATKDVEVYNAIFKSLREHFVD